MTDASDGELDQVLGRWAHLGCGFDVSPPTVESGEVDLERLILATARIASTHTRLFVVAATWLHACGDTIARHRLRRLVDDELEFGFRPALGLLLDTAQQGTHPARFQTLTRDLPSCTPGRPYFRHAVDDEGLGELTRRCASALSRRWGLWMQPVLLKPEALRPIPWMMSHHPWLRLRADLRGDLRASVIAALRHDPDAGGSESRLAASAGGSRSQVRNALDNLRLTGRIDSAPASDGPRRRIHLGATT